MKAGWTTKRLGEVCEVIAGQSPEGKHYNHTAKGVPFYQGKKDFGERYLNPPTVWTTVVTKRAQTGDILMSVRAPVGPVNFTNDTVCIGRGLAAIRSGELIDREFLFHQLQHLQPLICGREGAVFASISRADIEGLALSFPPLPEQRRIVVLLDEAFAGLATAAANAERNLDNARELFESHLADVFSRRGDGWVERRLRDICEIKHGFAFEGKYFANEGEFVLLTPGNFNESGGYRDRGEKQKFYTGPIPNDFVLNEGDLLVAMTEQAAGLLGSPVLVPGAQRFLHNQRLGLVKPTPNVEWDPRFLFHVFNLPMVRKAIHDSASGTKVRHTSPTKIGDVLVYIPLMSTQRSIVAVLEAHFAETQVLAQLYKQKQAALAALKRSLLHQAFNGEL